MKKIVYLSSAIILLMSCADDKPAPEPVDHRHEVIDADKAFSKMSEEKGMRAAFMEYIDSNGVLLRPGSMPMIGGQAIDYLSQQEDSSYTLVWQPEGASVAGSGDLGYTYGVFKLTLKGTDSSSYGTYVSIWKKQADGKWKFTLDTGNDGIGE